MVSGLSQTKNLSASSKFAFTLAEVLITLGIIGVVAAMTIPTLMNNYQKTQYVTQLKKAYTQFNQALVSIANDYGCTGDLKCTDLFAAGTTDKTLGDEIVKYFTVVKNCSLATGQGCFSADTNYNYDGSNSVYDHFDTWTEYKFVTADGIAFRLINYQNNCGNSWSTGKANNMSQTCGYINIDVNGAKGPNNYGKDTFWFFITNGKGPLLYPYGGIDDNHGGTNNWWKDPANNTQIACYPSNKYGKPCTGRVMEEGWQMNY